MRLAERAMFDDNTAPSALTGILFLGAGLYYTLYALLLLIAAIGFVAHRSLLNNLKRYDPSQWEALGSPELFKVSRRQFTGANGIRDEWRMFRYILSMQYRRSDNQVIKNAGDVEFGCILGMWFIAICLLTIGG
jgi:hypothetical protein